MRRAAGIGGRRWRWPALFVAAVVLAVTVPALAQVSTPARVTLAPVCGPAVTPGGPAARYAIQVDGENFNPFASVLVSFDFAAGGRPETFSARTNGFGRFSITINPLQRPPGAFVVHVDDLRQREANATFTVPCTETTTTSSSSTTLVIDVTTSTPTTTAPPPAAAPPALRLDPAIGPPGFVTFAVGNSFPAGAPVKLTWAPGLTAVNTVVVAGADGTFRFPVLLFRRDFLGPRQLRATPAGDVPFAPASAAFLVVPGNAQPRDFRDRR